MDREDFTDYFRWFLIALCWVALGLGVIFLLGWGISKVPAPKSFSSYEQQAIDACKNQGGIPEYSNIVTAWGGNQKVTCKK